MPAQSHNGTKTKLRILAIAKASTSMQMGLSNCHLCLTKRGASQRVTINRSAPTHTYIGRLVSRSSIATFSLRIQLPLIENSINPQSEPSSSSKKGWNISLQYIPTKFQPQHQHDESNAPSSKPTNSPTSFWQRQHSRRNGSSPGRPVQVSL